MGTLLNRRRYMGGDSSLPYDAEVEYIASTGSADFYIDTGISRPSPFNSAEIQTKVQFISTSGRQIHGATDAFYFGVNAGRWECNYNVYASTADTTTVHDLSKKLTISNNRTYQSVSLDGTSIWTNNYSYNNSNFGNNIGIFKVSSASTSVWYAKIYAEKIYINNELVRDFIPVRVGTTGYMYDKVSGTLFGNAGTGNFVLGPDKT